MKQFMRCNFTLLILLMFMICLNSCATAPDTFTPAEKVQLTTLKTLKSAKIFRVAALQSTAVYYKRGLIEEKDKEQIIEIGDQLQLAINIAADALIIYKETESVDDMANMDIKIMQYQQIFNQFMELVSLYLVEDD